VHLSSLRRLERSANQTVELNSLSLAAPKTKILLRPPGLVYIRLPDNANSASSRLAALFFLTLIFQMTPFSYMSFYFADRRFFIRDSANGLYAPSAYQLAAVTAGTPPPPLPFPFFVNPVEFEEFIL
jgi:hypothetical protein